MVELRLTELFLDVVNRSISAGWLILLLVVLRPLLKQGLKWGLPLLWGMVGLRLLLPWSPESPLSLVPSRETLPPDILLSPAPAIHSGVPALNSALNPVITEAFQPNPAASFNPLQVWCFIAALIWLLGLALLMLYALLSTWLLRRRLRDAVLLRDRLYQSRRVSTPFVFGIFRPRIYLPFYMPEAALDYAAAHEEAHIRRRDHWWKPLGFLLLAFHWFNPLAWLAYSFLCRDIELA